MTLGMHIQMGVLTMRRKVVLYWCLWCFWSTVSIVDAQTHLAYNLVEETTMGTVIADLKQDANLESERTFVFLTSPKLNLEVDQSSGILRTSGRIDRDAVGLCAGLDDCSDTFKVAIKTTKNQFIKSIEITVVVLDLNDNQPVFPPDNVPYRVEVLESAPPGYYYVSVPPASDPDSPVNGTQGYTLESASTKFNLMTSQKGDGSWDVRLSLVSALDREIVDQYQLKVTAYDGGVPAKSGTLDVIIDVLDTNDNSPKFTNSTYEIYVQENIPVNTVILQVSAFDPDIGPNGQVVYSWDDQTKKNYGHIFSINNHTGAVYVVGTVDYETNQVIYLTVIAQDLGKDPLPSDATVIVNVQDMNDNPPEITINTLGASSQDVANIAEDAPPNTFVAHVSVQDKDSGKNGEVQCTLNETRFTMAQADYNVLTAASLDRETRSFYNLAIICRDKGDEPQISVGHIHVHITDVNDNSPQFSKTSYSTEIAEGNTDGLSLLTVNASDPDEGENARIRYSVAEDSDSMVAIHPITGVIYALESFDREDKDKFIFTVIASDQGSPVKSTSVTVVINILDINDEQPIFSQAVYPLGVYENRAEGTEVGVVVAHDNDLPPNNQFSYSFPQNHPAADTFAIHPDSGKIFTTRVLDRELVPMYALVIFAIDQGNPPLTGSTTVSVHVVDVNDNEPVIEFPKGLNNSVSVPNTSPVGHVVTKIEATDADAGENQKLSYYIRPDSQHGEYFTLDENSGVLATAIILKDHTGMEYTLDIEVIDNGDPRMTTSTSLVVVVKKAGFPLGQNIIIVLVVSVLSGVIVAILIIAICLVKRQDYITRRTLHKYNCRTEAAKVLHGQMESSVDSDQWSPTYQAGIDPKDAAFVFHSPSPRPGRSPTNWPPPPDQSDFMPHPSWLAQDLSQKCPEKEVELLEILQRTDRDNDSAYSGDGSNTDSGRGGSVEGDQRPQPDVVRFSCVPERGSGRRKPEANQGFHVEDEPGRSKTYPCIRLQENRLHDSPSQYTVEYRKPVGSHYNKHNSDKLYDNSPSYHDIPLTNNGRAGLAGSIQRNVYPASCETFKGKPCNNLETVIEDDATTTTSGSYVMDQNDLAEKMEDFGYSEISV